MFYVINLVPSRFCRQLDEVAAIRLASVSGLFASFKFIFHINQRFSWQVLDLFLGLFSPPGRQLIWEVDDLVEFVEICSFFMVSEFFLSSQFRATITANVCQSFRENQFCGVLFALKRAGYFCLARDVINFASTEYEYIFSFDDLVSAQSIVQFRRCVEQRLVSLYDELANDD